MDNDLFFAAEKPEVTILISAGKIARVEPPIAYNLPGGLVVVPVSGHETTRLDPDAADRAGTDQLSLVIANLDTEPGSGRSDGAALDYPRRGIEGGKTDLGHAVAFVDAKARLGGELIEEHRRHFVGP